MILLLIALFLIVILGAVVALVQHRRLQKIQQQRLNKYLKGTQDDASEIDQAQLFNQKSTLTGWRLALHQRQLRISLVLGKNRINTMIIIALLAFYPCWFISDHLSALTQLGLIFSAYVGLAIITFNFYSNRQHQLFEQDFPIAIAAISRAVSAGVTVPVAMEHVAEQMDGPVSDIFQEINQLLAIGVSLEDALNNATLQLKEPSFKFFTVTLLLNQSSGGQLSQVLRQLMANLHERKAFRKKALAMTAEPRTSGKIIACLPVCFVALFYVMSPDIFDYLLNDPAGQDISVYVVCSISLGLFLISRMTKVEV